VNATTAGVLIDDSRFVRDAVLGRLRQVRTVDALARSGGTGAGSGGFATGALAGTDPSRGVTVWSQGVGARTRVNGDDNAAGANRGVTGLFGGADLALADGAVRAGIAGGYTSTGIQTDPRRGSASVDTGHVAAYAGARLAGFALSAGAAGAFHDIDTTRDILATGYAGRLTSNGDGNTLQGFAEIGYGAALGKELANVGLEPFAGIAVVRFDRDGASETGASIAGLSIRSDDRTVTFTTVGLRAGTTIDLGNDLSLSPRGSLAYQHASGDTVPTADLAFLQGGAGAAPFRVAGTPLVRDAFLFEAGLAFGNKAETFRFTLDYQGRVGDGLEEHAVRGGVALRF